MQIIRGVDVGHDAEVDAGATSPAFTEVRGLSLISTCDVQDEYASEKSDAFIRIWVRSIILGRL